MFILIPQKGNQRLPLAHPIFEASDRTVESNINALPSFSGARRRLSNTFLTSRRKLENAA